MNVVPSTSLSQRATGPPNAPTSGKAGSGRRAHGLRWRSWAVALVLKPVGVVVRCLAILLPLVLLAGGLIYLRLLHDSISMRFLAAPIARALTAEAHGYVVAIEDAILRRSGTGGVEFRLKNVRLADPQGREVAAAALAGIELSPRSLLSARLAPSRIELIDPHIRLFHDESGRLAISFTKSAATDGPARAKEPTAVAPADGRPARSDPVAADSAGGLRFDVIRSFAALVTGLRRSDATASLQGFGLRNATVVIEEAGRTTSWHVLEMALNLKHQQKRSVLEARARLATGGEPWSLRLKAVEAEKAQTMAVEARFEGLVPRGMAQAATSLGMLDGLGMPIAGTVAVDLGFDGVVQAAKADLELGAGQLFLPWLDKVPLAIDQGSFAVRYAGQSQLIEMLPSKLQWAGGRIAVEGAIRPDGDIQQASSWRFGVNSIEGELAGASGRAPPIPIERLALRGSVGPQPGRFEIAELLLKLGGAELMMTGTGGGGHGESTLEGRLSPMSIATLKAVWPVALAPRARAFAVESLNKGQVKSGSFRIATGDGGTTGTGAQGDRRLSLTLEAADLEVETRRGFPALDVPRALLRVEGTSLELTVPDASIVVANNRRITFKGGRATVVDIDKPRPVAEIAARAQGPLAAVLDLLDREPIGLLKGSGIPLANVEGKTDTQLRVTLPLGGSFSPNDLKIEGKARITEGRIKDVIGTHDISGAAMTIDANDKGVELRGEMLLAGVLAKLKGQWIANSPGGRQPPLSITARLDTADRSQLGLDLDDLVQGEIPLELLVHRGAGDELKLHVVADLTGAELILDEVQWRKPVGRAATLEFDVGRGKQPKSLELQNFKVSGDSIAIDGWVGIGPDHKPRDYYFPEFSLNVVTNLEVQGTLRPDRVWEVKAQGKIFDGQNLFRSLLAFGQEPAKPVRKNKPGVDLSAEIATVLGPNDTALRQVKIKAQKRAEKLVALELTGVLEGGQPLSAHMRPEPGRPRMLLADTPDAGQGLKLIGLYPNMVGGRAQVEVDLDGRGAAEKTGRIKIRNFRVLGDPVVAEVLQNADEGRPAIAAGSRRNRVVREQFDFERFDAAFAVGNSQMVIDNAVALGPLIGASMRGKIDFKAQRMQLGGTYVPLSGLSRFVGQIPVLGPILTGPRGEGVLGITFAIEGAMADPQVIINPLSIVGLGITREIFQMAPENPKITPRAEPVVKGAKGSGPQVRASPPTEAPPSAERAPRADPEVLDGWSSSTTTKDAKGAKKK